MTRLSRPIQEMAPHYDAVIVGSGYGGGIAASRLARAGRSVCVLERGREFEPGDFPDTGPEAASEIQVAAPGARIGNDTALLDFHVGDDINVLVGCGLGGTSLINANVALRADPRVFDDSRWPAALRADVGSRMVAGYKRAEDMLRPVPYPAELPPLPKLQALEKSAAALGLPFYRPPINVTFADGPNHVGYEQKACTLCGDCVSGCNNRAKNTVATNYLPDARNHGAQIFTQASVRRIEPAPSGSGEREGRWLVFFDVLDAGRGQFNGPPLFVSADVVVVAAGSLGSTEILLRSKAAGLAMSDRVGHGFTGNGDVLGFGYNNDVAINGIGFGTDIDSAEPVGPCISGIIDARSTPEFEDGMVIEEGSVPGALKRFLPEIFGALSRLAGTDTDGGIRDWLQERQREVGGLLGGPGHGAVHNTQTYLVMTHDDGDGRIVLDGDRVRVVWPGVGSQPIFDRINDRLTEATAALGGTYVRNPIWSDLFNRDLITVHPLGGCPMAEDAEHGVVDDRGRVFSGRHGGGVHEGLYVLDGSIVPRPLGVNPLLTISALAERGVELLAEERGWTIDWAPLAPADVPSPRPVGVAFTETMGGSVELEDGQSTPFRFVLTIYDDDVERIEDPDHDARMAGTVLAPGLSPQPLTVTQGRFNLFLDELPAGRPAADPDDPGEADGETIETIRAKYMRYRMELRSVEGRTWTFEGLKEIRDERGFDLWADTTTLHVTLREGSGPEGDVVGRGILRIRPQDFLHQLGTMKAVGTSSVMEGLKALERFGMAFAGSLFEIYGGIDKLVRNRTGAQT